MTQASEALVPLLDEDVVSRHLFRQDHYKRDPNNPGLYLVKKDAFQPRKRADEKTGLLYITLSECVSVTCHRELTDENLNECGQEVLDAMSSEGRKSKSLLGRAELQVNSIRRQATPLDVKLTPNNGGRNHADILDWPSPIREIAELNELMTELTVIAGNPILY